MFRFKQFTVNDDRCAMKVGTDGVLLGAWAEIGQGRRVLDIGSGSGLIALMAAQRGAAETVGVEIDPDAAAQARENMAASPFAATVGIVCADIRTFTDAEGFDCIVSNPPFFVENTLSPDSRRAAARHADTLTFPVLTASAARLLRPGGLFQLIVPAQSARNVHADCTLSGLTLVRRTDVATRDGKAPKRTLLAFTKGPCPTLPLRDTLTLFTATNEKTAAYAALTADFYL